MRFWTPKIYSKTNVQPHENEHTNLMNNQTKEFVIDSCKQTTPKEIEQKLYIKALYKIQQRNIMKTEFIVTDIIKNLRTEDPSILLLKAIKCIEAMTGDTVTYKLVLKTLKGNNDLDKCPEENQR